MSPNTVGAIASVPPNTADVWVAWRRPSCSGVLSHTNRGLTAFCRTSTAALAPATMRRRGCEFPSTTERLENDRDFT
jgi:hypothetical protein